MRSLVISDLHLGIRSEGDVLRRPAVRRRLLAELERADQLVLLGDVLELRERPLAEALELAKPVFADLGEALGDRRIVLLPGNHDHQLARPLLHGRTEPLGLAEEMRVAPSDPLGPLARALGSTELVLAYPGMWLRSDVYATHGHYLDVHGTVPTFEVLAIALLGKVGGSPPGPGARPADYEAALAPVYSAAQNLGQAVGPAGRSVGADTSIRLWQRLSRAGGQAGLSARLVAGVVVPGAIEAVNRAGLGPFRANFSSAELRRAALQAMGEVIRRLDVAAAHVVFGHTHRTGPLSASDNFAVPDGPQLTNAGCWVYEPAFASGRPGESPYWPGGMVEVGDEGPPRLHRLLNGLGHLELEAATPDPPGDSAHRG